MIVKIFNSDRARIVDLGFRLIDSNNGMSSRFELDIAQSED